MPERNGRARNWVWMAVGVVALLSLAVMAYALVLTQGQLRVVRAELGRANEQLAQARAGATDLERLVANLKKEIEARLSK